MSSNSALASLTATYTDSEGEQDDHYEEGDTDGSTESQVIIPVQKQQPEPPPPDKVEPKKTGKAKKSSKRKKAVRRLVSYNDDTIVSDEEREISDDEDMGEEEQEEDQDVSLNETSKADESEMQVEDSEKENKLDKFSEYGFSLPPEVKGVKCAVELQEKINHLYEKMKNTNMDMNKVIQERKEFRNPSIYEKLIQFCDINELGTNYPPEIYDPLQWGTESFYEELAKAQKIEMDKREKEKKENSKVELAVAAAKKVEEEAKKRKSKWDQPGPSAAVAGTQANLKPAGLVQPSLTTNITGTKGTVISAFGSLPKKPKA